MRPAGLGAAGKWGGRSGLALAEAGYLWGKRGGGLGRVSAASGPPAPVLVSVLDGGVVVVTALVCGVARAVCWCARIPSVLGRPALIKTQSDRLVGPLSRKKINHWALAVLLRGSDRCPTHVGSGCELVARVVSSVTLGADWSRPLFTSSGVRLWRGGGKGEGLRRGHIWVVHSRVCARARGRVRARVRASGTRHVCGAGWLGAGRGDIDSGSGLRSLGDARGKLGVQQECVEVDVLRGLIAKRTTFRVE